MQNIELSNLVILKLLRIFLEFHTYYVLNVLKYKYSKEVNEFIYIWNTVLNVLY